jgi:hypothetical protein
MAPTAISEATQATPLAFVRVPALVIASMSPRQWARHSCRAHRILWRIS